jgi:hypothetical protein
MILRQCLFKNNVSGNRAKKDFVSLNIHAIVFEKNKDENFKADNVTYLE